MNSEVVRLYEAYPENLNVEQRINTLLDIFKRIDPENYNHAQEVAQMAVHFADCVVQTIDIPPSDYKTWEYLDPQRVHRAGMLHDIGSAKLPKNLLFKTGSFTDAERMAVERVPAHSAHILSNIPGFEWLPQMVSRVHSSGEPEGSEANREFAEDAQVMGISIVFEACIHKRPDREAMTGHQALEELITHKFGFSNQIIKAMIKTFSVYPFNEFVVLNTGEIGQVVDIHRENPMRPTVRVLFTADRKAYSDHRAVDLAQNSSVHIARAITWRELTSMVATAAG